MQADAVLAGSVDTEAMYQLGSVMDVVIMDRAASAGPASKKRRVLSAVLRTACVLLLPPLHNFGSSTPNKHMSIVTLLHCIASRTPNPHVPTVVSVTIGCVLITYGANTLHCTAFM